MSLTCQHYLITSWVKCTAAERQHKTITFTFISPPQPVTHVVLSKFITVLSLTSEPVICTGWRINRHGALICCNVFWWWQRCRSNGAGCHGHETARSLHCSPAELLRSCFPHWRRRTFTWLHTNVQCICQTGVSFSHLITLLCFVAKHTPYILPSPLIHILLSVFNVD